MQQASFQLRYFEGIRENYIYFEKNISWVLNLAKTKNGSPKKDIFEEKKYCKTAPDGILVVNFSQLFGILSRVSHKGLHHG